jgi:hypothetical protein
VSETAEMKAMFDAVAAKFSERADIAGRARIGAAQMRKKAEGHGGPEQEIEIARNLRELFALLEPTASSCTVSTRPTTGE